jgi:hypothetical protein
MRIGRRKKKQAEIERSHTGVRQAVLVGSFDRRKRRASRLATAFERRDLDSSIASIGNVEHAFLKMPSEMTAGELAAFKIEASRECLLANEFSKTAEGREIDSFCEWAATQFDDEWKV